MGILLDKISNKTENSGFFCAVTGCRLSGKSTLAGTLPGKTILIQPSDVEAGNLSPKQLAEANGNELTLVMFSSIDEAMDILDDPDLLEYDNIYFDGISGTTEMLYDSPAFAIKSKANKWDGFAYIGKTIRNLIAKFKELAELHNKRVFITMALDVKLDGNGEPAETKLVAKGNITRSEIEGKVPNVICTIEHLDDKGNTVRQLLTRSVGPFLCRLGDLLDDANPGVIDANLVDLLTLVGRK